MIINEIENISKERLKKMTEYYLKQPHIMDAFVQILSTIPQGFMTGLLLNGTLIVLAYYFFWKHFKKRLKNWKIELKGRVDRAQIIAELKNSVGTLMVGATFSSIVIFLGTQGYTEIYIDFSKHPIWLSISGFFILLIIDDTWFYWMHRLMHHPSVYRYVHKVHHESIDVNPFTAMSFHWIEAFLLSFWILPVSLYLPVYAPTLLAVQLWGALDNIKAHLGYEIYPTNFNKSWLRFLTSSTQHNMHHSKFQGNYGVHFRFWDKLCGTEFSDYEQNYDRIQERKREKA